MNKKYLLAIALLSSWAVLALTACGAGTAEKDEINKETTEIDNVAESVNPDDFNPANLDDVTAE